MDEERRRQLLGATTLGHDVLKHSFAPIIGKQPCPRCGGKGKMPQYAHVAQGKCFRCDGAGHVMPES